jgi:hypothetical protein
VLLRACDHAISNAETGAGIDCEAELDRSRVVAAARSGKVGCGLRYADVVVSVLEP